MRQIHKERALGVSALGAFLCKNGVDLQEFLCGFVGYVLVELGNPV